MNYGEILIDVNNVSKKFCRDLKKSLWYGMKDITRELAMQKAQDSLRDMEFWALKDVSITLRRREALGIIGPNGAGKSTLLRLLSGLIKPNSGSVRVRGRLQALIELGSGFNPILTGRENIYVNAAVLGIPKREVDKNIDKIIGFSEIDEFIDAPVRSYSSGMRVRLGFSIAIHVHPDVLVIDEVLAVGDQWFRRKARNAMVKLLQSNIGLIIVSHNLRAIIDMTHRTLWLDKGNVVRLGDTPTVCSEYVYRSIYSTPSGDTPALEYIDNRTGELAVKAVACWVGNRCFERHVRFDGHERDLRIELTLQAMAEINEDIQYVLTLLTLEGTKVGYVMINDFVTASVGESLSRTFIISTDFLHIGNYQLSFEIDTKGGPALEHIRNLVYFDIKSMMKRRGDHSIDLNYDRMYGSGRGPVILPVKRFRRD